MSSNLNTKIGKTIKKKILNFDLLENLVDAKRLVLNHEQ